MPENDPPKLRVGLILCSPCRATLALLGTQGQVFLKTRRSKHRRRLGAANSRESRGGGEALHGRAGSWTCNGSRDDQSENLPAWRAETNDRALARKPRPDSYFWRAWLSAGSSWQAEMPSFRAAATL